MCLLRLLWSCCLASADSPDGLISNNDFGPICDLLPDSGKLSRVDLIGLLRLTLIELFADACHNREARIKSHLSLLRDDFIGFAEDVSALAVSKNDPIDTKVFDLGCGSLTCVRARLVKG